MSIAQARELRNNATPAERAMWRLLKPFRDRGHHFRRQVQIGRYYADFACHHEKLVIEVDGDTHATGCGPERDEVRTRYIESRGFKVLRFSNSDVVNNAEGVFELVTGFLKQPPAPDPSPQGGGEQKEATGATPTHGFLGEGKPAERKTDI